MKNKSGLVSVCMITYNHEKYIKHAIESILMQKTNFPIELVISEDCSTDNTRLICKDYKVKFPDIIQLKLQEKNIGMIPNFFAALKACTGEYIAICEGDDYWTDPNKLQKQIDFLEANKEYVLCFHNANIKNDIDGSVKLFRKYRNDTYDGNDILKRWLMPTASVVFRNIIPDVNPVYFNKTTHGDLALFLFLANFGKLKLIKETMSVYRINPNNITLTEFKGIEHNLKHIEQIDEMNLYFDKKYKRLLNKRKNNYLLATAYLYSKIGDIGNAKRLIRKVLNSNPTYIIKDLKTTLKIYFYILFKVAK